MQAAGTLPLSHFPEGLGPGVHVATQVFGDTVCLGKPSQIDVADKVDPKHKVHRTPAAGCEKRGQVGAQLIGPSFGFSYVCRSCSCNAMNAFVNRHGGRQPTTLAPLPPHPRLEAEVRRQYVALEQEYYDGWFDKWPASKQAAILRSLDFDECQPNRVSAFIKREGGHSMPKKARLIQAYATLATQERCAREFSVFQKALSAVLTLDGFEFYPGIVGTFCSGFTGEQIGAWLTTATEAYDNPFFYERDGKNWDATMQGAHAEFKLGVMRAADPALAEFTSSCRNVRGSFGFGAHSFQYSLKDTVKSGHNDTTSGNSLINAYITARALLACGLRGRFIVAGDDMLAVVDGDFDVRLLAQAERDLGIVPEARKFLRPEDTSFVSGVFLRDSIGGGLGFFPCLGRLLTRLWWTTKSVPPRGLRDFRFSVASGLEPSVGHLPVYSDLLAPALLRGGRLVETGKMHHSAHVVRQSGDYTHSLAERYGVTVTELMAFGRFVRSAGDVPSFLVHDLYDVIVRKDLADICDRYPVATTLS